MIEQFSYTKISDPINPQTARVRKLIGRESFSTIEANDLKIAGARVNQAEQLAAVAHARAFDESAGQDLVHQVIEHRSKLDFAAKWQGG